MQPDIQHVHVVMWEPPGHMSPTPFEFMWSRDLREADNWRAGMLNDRSAALTVYSATLPLPTDGDFASDEGLERSLRHILTDWPRNEAPPPDQAVNGRFEYVGAV